MTPAANQKRRDIVAVPVSFKQLIQSIDVCTGAVRAASRGERTAKAAGRAGDLVLAKFEVAIRQECQIEGIAKT